MTILSQEVSISRNPRIFPTPEHVTIVAGNNETVYLPDVAVPRGPLAISGSLEEGRGLEFVSTAFPKKAGEAINEGRDWG